jgi:glycine/D-amino acid oxidase-like deaminating enzyme
MQRHVSPWLDEVAEHAPPLDGDIEVDVAIIGAGYTGLSAALELHSEGLRVALLEAEFAGFGASGRNAGHLTPTIGKDLPTLTRLFGRDRVRGLVHLADLAIGYVESLIAAHGIDCEYEPVGNVVAAVHPRQHRNLDRTAEAAREYGVPGEILEPAEMCARGLPASFTRGYFEPHGGILHPGRYVRGLRAAALRAGAALYEKTPVTRLEEGSPAVVHTARGRACARHVVLATNAFTPGLGFLRSTVLPMYVQLFRTAPLGDRERRALDWRGREGIYTAHEMLESYRLTRDGRIVGGAKYVRYGFGGQLFATPDPGIAARLEEVFRVRFPELRDLAITDHWGGPIALSLDFLPLVGRVAKNPNLLYSAGYAGHGLAQASYAGRMIADLLLERDGPGRALWTRPSLPLPPEPLRWLVVHALTALFGGIDRRVDRRIGWRGARGRSS